MYVGPPQDFADCVAGFALDVIRRRSFGREGGASRLDDGDPAVWLNRKDLDLYPLHALSVSVSDSDGGFRDSRFGGSAGRHDPGAGFTNRRLLTVRASRSTGRLPVGQFRN